MQGFEKGGGQKEGMKYGYKTATGKICVLMEVFVSQSYQYQYLIVIVIIVLQDVTAEGNQVNGMRDLSVLYFNYMGIYSYLK